MECIVDYKQNIIDIKDDITYIIEKDFNNDGISEKFTGIPIRYFNGELIYTVEDKKIIFPAKAYNRIEWKYYNHVLPMALVQLQESFGLILGHIMLEFILEEGAGFVPHVVSFHPERMEGKNINFKVFPSRVTLELQIRHFMKYMYKISQNYSDELVLIVLDTLIFTLSDGKAKLVGNPIMSYGKISRNSYGYRKLRKLPLIKLIG